MIHAARIKQLVGAVFLAGATWSAWAADYPARPITMVITYPPGASTDSLGRVAAAELGKALSVSIVVENKPGGETTIGTRAVKNARADGYTILMQSGGLMTAAYALKEPGYKLSDFVAVSPLIKTPFVLLVPSSIPSGSIDEYFAYARNNATSMNHATLGSGANNYKVLGDAVMRAGGFKWTDIPYKGGMEGVQALLSGQVQAYFATVSLAVSQQKQPLLKALAVTDTKRSVHLPDVPTFAEKGYPNVIGHSLYGVYVRAETPEPIQRKLQEAMRKVMASDAMKKSIDSMSMEPYSGSLENFSKEVRDVAAKFAADVQRLGLERN